MTAPLTLAQVREIGARDRNIAFRRRVFGDKYTDLAAKYGIAASTARSICEHSVGYVARNGLEIRAHNSLARAIGFPVRPEVVATLSVADLLEIENLGPKCIASIREWLARRGLGLRGEGVAE